MNEFVKPLIIIGSARSTGNTRKVVDRLINMYDCDVIDLNDWQFSYYDYDHRNQDDDFIKVIERVLLYDTLIFASPIYWYSMSAIMKNFFDRISDLLKIRKEQGRQLRGKTMFVLSCSEDPTIYPSFAKTFELSADYLGMHYGGYIHTWLEDGKLSLETENELEKLSRRLMA